ncbi:hepatic lectin-like isoform X2 [Clupea harengus]|uniref:Hepatic lectin-like isoform X2 n=1 Tax=Clupea harengus TaxID=7950 RepID=A0A8M1KR15_CLUHA|nr:hepatic lectin-like isoform X2 [Clupea harengus]
MSEDKICSDVMPKDTPEDSTTAQSSKEANCCQVIVDEMGLLKLKLTILAVLSVILGSFLVAFQVLSFMKVENADISQKLGMLQEEYDNATAMTRTLGADLTGVKKCADDWEYFDGSCYHFSTDKKTWTESRDACVTMEDTWSSLPVNKKWFWKRGEPNNFGAVGEEHCVVTTGEWNDVSCGYPMNRICETICCRAW